MRRRNTLGAAIAFVCLAIGCAAGEATSEENLGWDAGKTGNRDASTKDSGKGSSTTPGTSTTEDPDTTPSEAGGPTTTDGGTTKPDGSTTPGDGGTTPPDSGGSPTACDAVEKCGSAGERDLGSMSGDTSSDQATATDTRSVFMKLKVADSWNLPSSVEKATITLTPPADADFDLFVYVPSSGPDVRECSVPSNSSAQRGNGLAEQVKVSWPDNMYPADDTRTLTVEARYVSGGSCGPSSTWTLLAEGNK